jgi:ATP-dependent DNA helicase RecQ
MTTDFSNTDSLHDVVARHWGYSTLRPLQEQAMRAILEGRDSMVVLPTGGGKSLCYQAPALIKPGLTVVVSPLISLMKDQVDTLRENGIAAAQIDSSITAADRQTITQDILDGQMKLLFVSPERLVLGGFQDFLARANVRTFAIDEAHCISHWGHDFRPEYRQLAQLKQRFPDASVHAFTATATEGVRRDIIDRLALTDPDVLVGNFDRPNLTYRITPRRDELAQVQQVLERHPNEAGIIYCIRRKDVDALTQALSRAKVNVMAYHAGMTPVQRQKTQEAFASERCDLIVATVAFGMGIDRSNIRFVLHTAMPKSIEHYQQETGRAGRDGLAAECTLLYSGADAVTWKSIIDKSAAEAANEAAERGEVLDTTEFVANANRHLNDMDRYCRGSICRHRVLVEYFGQAYEAPEPEAAGEGDPAVPVKAGSCQRCDVCLDESEELADAQIVAQKIISCVARLDGRFGIGQVVSILRGENTERVRKFSHEKLSTYGLLKERGKTELRDLIYQLISQGALRQVDLTTAGGATVPLVQLSAKSRGVLKGEVPVRLTQPRMESPEKAKKSGGPGGDIDWEGVDRELFDALRVWRREAANERAVPPYVIFSDATLRELARVRPSTLPRLQRIYGLGERKLAEFGPAVLARIAEYVAKSGIALDQGGSSGSNGRTTERRSTAQSAERADLKSRAATLFAQGADVESMSQQLMKSVAVVYRMLEEWVAREQPASIDPWVPRTVQQRVNEAIDAHGTARLRPLFEHLDSTVPYELIRLVVAQRGAA